jgi:hypothetical protein
VIRDYDQASNQSSGDDSPIYLIAFKDPVIRAAIAYWVEGKTLHYITLQLPDNSKAFPHGYVYVGDFYSVDAGIKRQHFRRFRSQRKQPSARTQYELYTRF